MSGRRLAGAVLVLSLLLVSCGGSDGDSGGDGAAGPSGSASSASSSAPPPSPSTTTPGTLPPPAPPSPSATAGSPAAGAVQPTVPARPVRRLPPVPLTGRQGAQRPAEVGALRVDVVEADPVVSAGAGPGQVQGEDAVALTVRWTNGGATPVALGNVVVDLSYGAGVPASPVNGPPSRAVGGSVAPGASASGVYVFAVPLREQDQVELSVRQGAALPTAVFVGPVS